MIGFLLSLLLLINSLSAQDTIDWCAELAHLPPNTAYIIMQGTFNHLRQLGTQIGHTRSPDNPITLEPGGYTLGASTIASRTDTDQTGFDIRTGLLTLDIPAVFEGMLPIVSNEDAYAEDAVGPLAYASVNVRTSTSELLPGFYLNQSGWMYLEAMDDVYYRAAFDVYLESNRGERLHVQGVLHLAYGSMRNLRIESLLRRLGRVELLGVCDPHVEADYTLD